MEPAVLRFITHHFFYFLISQMSNSGDVTPGVEQVELAGASPLCAEAGPARYEWYDR
jgi:hypothetical protein